MTTVEETAEVAGKLTGPRFVSTGDCRIQAGVRGYDLKDGVKFR